MNNAASVLQGGCHCGAVRFRFSVTLPLTVYNCNCSICRMSGFQHVIVTAQEFELLQGQECLSEYTFNTGTARHLFCSRCGVKSFYRPRSHPEGWSINFRCLDKSSEIPVNFKDFDGENWESSVSTIR